MNKKIEKILEDDYKKHGWDKWNDDDELLDGLREYNNVYEKKVSEHRWWNIYQYVVKVGNVYIGYLYAETTGDMSPREAGFDFDSDSICEMKPVEEIIITYIKKN